MRAAIIENGVVANMVLVDQLGPGMVACPEHGPGDLWDGVAFSHPAPPLAEAKAQKLAQIEADRDRQVRANVSALGRVWQADDRSQKLLGDAITLAHAGLPLPPVWRDVDNQDMPITGIADLLAIAGAMAAQTQAAYSESWGRKAAVLAATHLAEIESA